MNTDPVTLPFLTYEGLYGLIVALVIALAIGLVWMLRIRAGRQSSARGEDWMIALAWVLAPVWVAILGATLWGLWQVFNGAEESTLGDTSFGLGALIAAFLGAPFVIYGTWLRYKTQRLEQEGHMTERITAAVEQLGAEKTVKEPSEDGETVERTVPNIEVRMGAILSLERIAQDSTIHDNGRDHVRVMEILCAYIRENSNARRPKHYRDPELVQLDEGATEEKSAAHLEARKARFQLHGRAHILRWAQVLPKPRADVQLALTVIGRRSAAQRQVEAAWPSAPAKTITWPFDSDFQRLPDDLDDDPLPEDTLDAFQRALNAWATEVRAYRGYRIDLRGANLQGADMAAKQPDGSDAVFSGTQFDGARMDWADLSAAMIRGASFRMARMERATFDRARMEQADLLMARMENASFYEARMEGANLMMAAVEGADISEARMEGANLSEARMQGANLRMARMERADLMQAQMDGADLSGARMEGADLRGARMEGADLRAARMDSSTFLGSAILEYFPIKLTHILHGGDIARIPAG